MRERISLLLCAAIPLSGGFVPASIASDPTPIIIPVSGPSIASSSAPTTSARPVRVSSPVDLDGLPKVWRETLIGVIGEPTLTAFGPADEFTSTEPMYQWLLDHPDRVSLAWRRLKVPAVEIRPLSGGRFLYHDDQGNELIWVTVGRSLEGRVWYAEGKARAGALMPSVPVKAVAMLRHKIALDREGNTVVRHQVELYLQTDSKAAALLTKMLGPTAPRLAEQGAEQLQMFFGGMARQLQRAPQNAEGLLAEAPRKPADRETVPK